MAASKCGSVEWKNWCSGGKLTCIAVASSSLNGDHRELKYNINGLTPKAIEAIQIQSSSNSHFPLNLSKTFPNLAVLDIHNCGLTEISRSDLIGLEGLVELDLSCNKLTSLPRDLLTDMKKLKYISFYGNQIANLDVRMFDGIKNQLEMLNLGGNGLINKCYLRSGSTTIDEFLRTVDPDFETLDAESALEVNLILHDDEPFKLETVEVIRFMQELLVGFEDLWKTRRFSDFTILVAGKEFKVHKTVLAVRSKYFSTMFEENQEGKSMSRLTILKFAAEAFEDFLRFLYTGKIENRDNAMEIFSLAAIYEVADLKSLAGNIIWNKVDKSNAMEVLILANHHGSEELMLKSFAAIKSAHPEIKFRESLMRKPDAIKKQAREQYERIVENATKELEEATLKNSE